MTPESEALLAAAEAKLTAAEILIQAGLNGDAASRAYYAVFHAITPFTSHPPTASQATRN